ncbi:fungal-specific transcription factor domain-containing protein [Gautieria morchelliformis]|nr:fungal-specific transcription factor domain-containing protein [Gautieria morchelliformis]
MPPISSVRGDNSGPHEHMVHFPPLPGGPPFPPPPGQGHHAPLGPPQHHHPPLVGAMPVHLDPELAYMPPSYGQPPPQQQHQQQQQQQSSRPPMSSIPASPWPSAPSLQPPSSFGASYSIRDDYYNNQAQDLSPSSDIVSAMPPEISQSVFPFISDSQEASHVRHYMLHVLRIQYLLADPSIESFIFRFAQTSPTARSAMCLLSAVHQQRMRQIEFPPHAGADTAEMDHLFRQTRSMLRATPSQRLTEGDAMAGLHVVAIHWVRTVLRDERYRGPLDAYWHCTESMQFIIRTTMWFDVWSAVTRLTQPQFRDIYGELFDGEHGYPGTDSRRVDMLPVMGCTNETVLAMSETASLAFWKDRHTKQGDLSMPSLIERGRRIETLYLSREHDATLDSISGATDELDARRRLAADVFRSSARVYLHSVLSGCKPNVDEIKYGVGETVNFLKRVPGSEGASRSVVRSVV